MNNDEIQNDSVLTRELRDSLSGLATAERPPLEAITSRGRAHQRRRLAAFVATGAAAGTALALGLAGTFSAAPGRVPVAAPASGTGTIQATASASGTGTIQTTAFTLTSNANGTDTLTLTMSQVIDPAVLQQALNQHGIPALVKTGASCTSTPAPPNPFAIGVLSLQLPVKQPHSVMMPLASPPGPGLVNQLAARSKTVINPAKIPAGDELFFGYSASDHAVFVDLIDIHSYTCSNGQPPLAHA